MAARTQLGRRLIDLLELPPDAILDLPKLTLIGDRQLTIENHRGIIEYDPDLLRIATNRGEIRISGSALTVRSILKEEILLVGQIHDIDLVDWEGST